MRLTLRTLLAWLDDTLKPTQVREIGSQVAESPFAQELTERIHRVARQRRLSVPSSSGPDATDPNVVASYLDNDLDSDAVAEYEKQCLTSDVKLAEVACVHQILSLLGHKVKVPVEAKARMYQLVKGRESVSPRSREARRPQAAEPLTRPIPSWVDPDPIQRSWTERFGLVAASLALIAVSIATASWSLRTPPAEPVHTPIAIREPVVGQAAPSAPASGQVHPPVPAGPKQEDLAPAENGHAPGTNLAKNSGAAGSAAVAKTKEAAPGNASKAADTAAGALDGSAVKLPAGAPNLADAMGGILLRYNADQKEWERIVGPTPVRRSDRLLCLWPFRASISLHNVPLTMVGETEAQILSLPADKVPAIELRQGRLLVRKPRAGSIKVGFSGRMITVEIAPSAAVVLERTDRRQYGRPVSQPSPLVVYCTQGEVGVSSGQKEESLTASERLVIDASGAVTREAIDSPPSWATETEPSALERRLQEQFVRMFHPGRPVLTEIVIASESDNSDIRQLSILALKSLGELSLLMPMLSREGDAVTRRGALAAIRSYMALGPDAAGRVRDQLAAEFGDDTAAFVEKMLIGYTPEEASDPKLYERLVAALGPEKQSVGLRELRLIR